MYQATIVLNSPALDKVRQLLIKQRLMWDEEPATLTKRYNGNKPDESIPAVRIVVSNTKEKIKLTRKASVKKTVTVDDRYSSEALPSGHYLWRTPNGQFTVSFPYDQARLDKIKRDSRARIDKRLSGKYQTTEA